MSTDDCLRALLVRGFRFQAIRDRGGQLAVVVGSFGWPSCSDQVHLWSEHEAIAARVLPTGEVVWSHDADALSVLHALLELPDPGQPGAPHLARRAPFGLWLPAMA